MKKLLTALSILLFVFSLDAKNSPMQTCTTMYSINGKAFSVTIGHSGIAICGKGPKGFIMNIDGIRTDNKFITEDGTKVAFEFDEECLLWITISRKGIVYYFHS